MRGLLALSLAFFITPINANAADAPAHCPACHHYYRAAEGRSVSTEALQRVMGKVRRYDSIHGARRSYLQPYRKVRATRSMRSLKEPTRTIAPKPSSTAKLAEPEPAAKLKEEPQPLVGRRAEPADSSFMELLPPNAQLWEKLYPTQ
jgi:hypothetical protein